MEQHNYGEVKVNRLWYSYEDSFDLHVIKDTGNILKELDNFRGVDCIITIGSNIDFEPLNKLSFDFRKKWIHKDEFNAQDIAYSIIAVFDGNIGRINPPGNKTFSIFTSTYNTTEKMLKRLYESLKAQTYGDWDWFIIDDSTNSSVRDIIKDFNDPRITMFSNFTNHGSIGFNKHSIAMLCDGEYLVEVDHDDELLPNCLERLNEAFDRFPETDFVYSYCLENIEGEGVWYGDSWGKNGWGGGYAPFIIRDRKYNIALTADITPVSIRTIFTQPNHVRCWKRDFYHRIGGHNPELSVLDDADILIRTFLNGRMTKIADVLYIQNESKERQNGNGDNTQSKRYKEIQRTTEILRKKYDYQIHRRIEELGYRDCVWDNNMGFSNIKSPSGEIQAMNYILK